MAFNQQVAPMLPVGLLLLKPAATVLCMRSGAPGGLFTPSLTVGALLGAVLRYPLVIGFGPVFPLACSQYSELELFWQQPHKAQSQQWS